MDREYLLQHPTAMPVAEAAMTNVLEGSPPVLRLIVTPACVTTPDEPRQEELLAACGS